MRLTFLLPALGLASLGAAQTVFVNGAEQLIREAYENQRQNDGLVFEMRGSDVNSGSSAFIHAILYWRLSADPRTGLNSRAQAELDVYEGNAGGETLQMRIVGDGVSLYRYDIARRTVSTTLYGFYGTTPPAGYSGSDAPKLLAQMHGVTPGLASYLVRLLVEMNPAGANYAEQYTNWLPGHVAQIFDTVPYPVHQVAGININGKLQVVSYVKDPVSKRIFFKDPTTGLVTVSDPTNEGGLNSNEISSTQSTEEPDRWVFEGMDRLDTNRTVTFHIVPDPNNSSEWVVQTVYVAQRTADRFVDLRLTPNTGTAPRWAFVPYSGEQAAAFRPIAGGF